MYIREFNNFKEMLASVDEDINSIKIVLGELLRRVETLKIKVESEKALRDVLSKIGVSEDQRQVSNVVNLKRVRIYIKPTAEQELTSLESFIEYLSSRMVILESIKKELSLFASAGVEARIEVIYIDGLPREIYIR